MNTILEIYNKLKTEFEYVTGNFYKGLVQALGAGFASRLKEFMDKLKFIEKNAFVSTADKDYLYLHATEMTKPLPATIASGLGVVYGTLGEVLPASTELQDDGVTYKTASDATITTTTLNGTVTVTNGTAVALIANQLTNTTAFVNGESKSIIIIDSNTIQFEAGTLVTSDAVEVIVDNAIISILADLEGLTGNKALNDVLKIKTTIDGINSDIGVLQITGGADDEEVEDYRQRVLDFQANPQAPFSKTNIIRNIKNRMPEIWFVWVKGGEVVEGTVQVIAMNFSYGLTGAEQTEVLNNTKAIAPANLDIASISATVPTVSLVDVVLSDLLPASDGLKIEIQKNIEAFFNGDMYERTISDANLSAIIFQTKNGAESVQSFTIVEGSRVSQTNTFWRLNNVTFQ